MSLFDVISRRSFVAGAVWLAFAAFVGAIVPTPASSVEIGIAPVKVGAGPHYFDTAEQHAIRVEILTRGLVHAYSLAFLPNADALIVERGVRLRLMRNSTSARPLLVYAPVAGVPNFADNEHARPDDVLGLQDVTLHPDFSKNQLVYYTFNRPVRFDPMTKRLLAATVLARARLEGLQLVDARDLVTGEAVEGSGGSRVMFGAGNLVYVTVGALSHGDIQSAQRTDNIYGKVLRVRADGSIPEDNPFVKVTGARAEIYSLGHRDPLGITVHASSGSVIVSEHGPQGGDEINRIVSGGNYGWPDYTFGTDYEGSALLTMPIGPNTQAPLLIWAPAIAPGGTTFYTADKFPLWKNNLFVASSRRGQIDRTGALVRVVLNDNLQELRQEALLESLHQRIRDVRQGPDGLLYVLTDEDDSVLMRISPAPSGSHRE